jgi:hypothetical protein
MANRDEVEEFLRRAAARRAAAQQPRPPAPAPAPQWTPPVPQPPPPLKQPFQPQPLSQQQSYQQAIQQRRPATLAEAVMLEPIDSVEAELVEVELADQSDRVGRSVEMHMRGTQQVSEHARHLGEEVDRADDKLEARIHQVFDHKVGNLKKSTMEAAAASPSQAAREATLPGAATIARMLADPQSLRNALIMVEILKRPEQNW